jgi:CheY-like chemotaxis protein
MTEKTMSASQRGGPQVLDRPENSSNSAEASARETQVRFEDVDSPFQVILFADEEPEIVQARRLLLETLGFSVLIVDSGEKALDLRDGAIDAVVVDYRMPGKDGEQTARKIHEFGGNMPIILSSRCFSLPQNVLGLVDAPADKGTVSKALQDMLEQQFQALMHGDEILTN